MAAQDFLMLGVVVIGGAIVFMNKDAIASYFQGLGQQQAQAQPYTDTTGGGTTTSSGPVNNCLRVGNNYQWVSTCGGTPASSLSTISCSDARAKFLSSCTAPATTHAGSKRNKPSSFDITAGQDVGHTTSGGGGTGHCNCGSDNRCHGGSTEGEFCSSSPTAQAYPGYYRDYSIPVMGPGWYYSQPASRRPEDLQDPYRSYVTTVNPKTGAKTISVDPYFPAGFWNVSAGDKRSLKDPAIRGSS